jgi:hypothetical protein
MICAISDYNSQQMPAFVDLTGRRFGHWLVLGLGPRLFRNRIHWHCRCDCGNTSDVQTGNLNQGISQSCGCVPHKLRHGYTGTKEHRAWINMFQRCENPKNPHYHSYGGRGIRVSDEFRSFERFYAELGPCPDGCSLDRRDNNLGYQPGNVRWASRKTQSRNTRTNRILTWDGIALPVVAWAERVGLSKAALLARLAKGWPLEKALTTPPVYVRVRGRNRF